MTVNQDDDTVLDNDMEGMAKVSKKEDSSMNKISYKSDITQGSVQNSTGRNIYHAIHAKNNCKKDFKTKDARINQWKIQSY